MACDPFTLLGIYPSQDPLVCRSLFSVEIKSYRTLHRFVYLSEAGLWMQAAGRNLQGETESGGAAVGGGVDLPQTGSGVNIAPVDRAGSRAGSRAGAGARPRQNPSQDPCQEHSSRGQSDAGSTGIAGAVISRLSITLPKRAIDREADSQISRQRDRLRAVIGNISHGEMTCANG